MEEAIREKSMDSRFVMDERRDQKKHKEKVAVERTFAMNVCINVGETDQ